jgi:hypothetical protein
MSDSVSGPMPGPESRTVSGPGRMTKKLDHDQESITGPRPRINSDTSPSKGSV